MPALSRGMCKAGWVTQNHLAFKRLRTNYVSCDYTPSIMKKLALFLFPFAVVLISACRDNPKDPQQTPEPAESEMTAVDYAQLGRKKLYVDWEFNEAKEALLKAVELNPGDALSHANLAWYWMLEDDREKSMESIELAKQAAPEDPLWVQWHGWMCYFYDDFECAERYLKESIAMQPEQRDAYFVLGRMNYRNGNMEVALQWLDRAAQDSTGRAAKAMSLVLKGQEAEASRLIDSIRSNPESFERMLLVPLHNMIGKRDSAFYWLEKNYELRQPLLPWLRYMPILRPLHEDPRFWEMVEKIGRPEQGEKDG